MQEKLKTFSKLQRYIIANFTFLAQNTTQKSLSILLSITKSSPFQSVLHEALPAFYIVK